MSASPFIFTNGTGYLRNLKVQGADIVNLSVDYADISNVNIEAGVIAAGAVTSFDTDTGTLAMSAYAGWKTIVEATVDSDSGFPVVFFIDASVTGSRSIGNPVQFSTVKYRLVRLNDGKILFGGQFDVPVPTVGGGYSPISGVKFPNVLFDEVSAGAGYTYAIQVKSDDGASVGGEGNWLVQCNRK